MLMGAEVYGSFFYADGDAQSLYRNPGMLPEQPGFLQNVSGEPAEMHSLCHIFVFLFIIVLTNGINRLFVESLVYRKSKYIFHRYSFIPGSLPTL